MTNLDLEFLNWRDKNEEDLISRWNAIKEDYFLNFIEECWREYQDENNTNKAVEELILEQARERHYESKKVQENGLNPQIEAFMDAERNKEKNHL